MTITTRAAKGGPLTNAELDANFTDLRDLKAPIDTPAFTGAASFAGSVTVGGGTGFKQLYVAGAGYDLMVGASGGALFGYASQAISTLFNTTAVPLGIGTNAAQPIIFGTQSTERMRLDATGNLGIGTTAPRSRLSLGGTATNATGVPGGGPAIRVYDDGADAVYGIGASSAGGMEISANQPSQGIRFYAGTSHASPTERMRIGGNGNVLIGTATDNGSDRLQVSGPTKVAGFLTGTGGLSVTGSAAPLSGGSLEFGYGGGSGYFQSYNRTGGAYTPLGVYASTITFGVGGGAATSLFLPANGNVLVGGVTDNGIDKLQIFAGLSTTTNGAAGTQASPLRTQVAFRGYQNNRSAAIRSYDMTGTYAAGGGLEFLVNSNMGADTMTTALFMTPNGRVLVGTSTDNGTDALQVNGSAYIKSATTVGGYTTTTTTPLVNLITETGSPSLLHIAQHSMRNWYIGMLANSPDLTFQDASAGTERMRLDTSGNVLIGGTNNAARGARILSENASGAQLGLRYTGVATWYQSVNSAGDLVFDRDNAERMRISAAGNLLVGTANDGGCHRFVKTVSEGGMILDVFTSAAFYYCTADAHNGAASAMIVAKNSTTGRSINAGGTINANGADYAEYMTKAEGTGALAKGAVVGVDALGMLTDKFADAVSFVLKSTDPSYVGGDSWGTGLEGETLEVARAKVDRIAFAGQVPVNVHGATPGQYIVAQADGAGITGVAVDEGAMTLPLYMRAVGIVQNILLDGRANVRVKVA